MIKVVQMICLESTLIVENSKEVNYDCQLRRQQILMERKLQIKAKYDEARYERRQIIKAKL